MPAAFDPAEVPDLAPLIDHALLQPRLGSESIERGCEQALHYGFAGICLASRWMPQARQWLGERSSVRLISVLSFPFGACSSAIKRAEAEAAVEAGGQLEQPLFFGEQEKQAVLLTQRCGFQAKPLEAALARRRAHSRWACTSSTPRLVPSRWAPACTSSMAWPRSRMPPEAFTLARPAASPCNCRTMALLAGWP